MSQERYEIRKKLGEGGAGAVYIAHDTRLNREVALKRVAADQGGWSQDTVDSMLKEARMLSAVSHPNIVTIYDADVDEDGPYVVMELLEGRNIDDLIAENTLTSSDFHDFSTQCLEALVSAHSLDLIHRDIKPNNIVLKWLPSGKFQAKLLDFGMAKLTKEPTKQTVDQSDSVFGSIYFMAPEQFERIELDARTDLYALGSVFYYTLTGFYPFTGDSPAEVMAAHLTHKVKPVSDYRDDLPEWVSNWVMWLINREMEYRPQSAQEALDVFNANMSNDPLKKTSSVNSTFSEHAETHYFGREEGKAGREAATKASIKQEGAKVLAPVLLSAGGQLIVQAEHNATVPVAQPTVKVSQPTVKLATPAPTTVQVPTQAVAPRKVTLNTGVAQPTQEVTTQIEAPKTVQLATPQPTVQLGTQKHPETPLATVPLETPLPPAQPGNSLEANTPSYGAKETVALTSPAPQNTSKVSDQNSESSDAPSGETVELPTVESMAQPKSNNGLFVILSVIVFALVVVGGLLFYKVGKNKEVAAINELLLPAKQKEQDIPTKKADITLLLNQLYTVSGQFENNLLYRRLLEAESADGSDIDLQIATFATQQTEDILPEVRSALFLVLGGREGTSTVPIIQNFITSYDKDEVVIDAILALKSVASETDLDFFLNIILHTDNSVKRDAAEETATALIEKATNKEALASKISAGFTKAPDSFAKASLERLNGLIGGEDAKQRILNGLASRDRNQVIPALSVLKRWKDNTMTQEAITFWAKTQDKAIRKKAFDAAFSLMKMHHIKDPNALPLWTQLAKSVKTAPEKRDLLLGLGSTRQAFAIPLIKPFLDDTNSDVIRKAQRAIKNIQKAEKNEK